MLRCDVIGTSVILMNIYVCFAQTTHDIEERPVSMQARQWRQLLSVEVDSVLLLLTTLSPMTLQCSTAWYTNIIDTRCLSSIIITIINSSSQSSSMLSSSPSSHYHHQSPPTTITITIIPMLKQNKKKSIFQDKSGKHIKVPSHKPLTGTACFPIII